MIDLGSWKAFIFIKFPGTHRENSLLGSPKNGGEVALSLGA